MKKLTKSIVMMMVIIVTLVSTSVKIEANNPCAIPGCGRNACTDGRYCGHHTCCKNGCYKYRGSNGTVYCPVHAAEYVEKEGYTPCSECYGRRCSDSDYCYNHKCMNSYCHNKKASGSDYCTAHAPKKKTTTTKNSSSTSTKKKNSSSTSTKKKNSSSSKKKYDAYDVYNYKSAQDFADDKYEEFYDYEDYYDDEDEAYDAAEDYWRVHHGK